MFVRVMMKITNNIILITCFMSYKKLANKDKGAHLRFTHLIWIVQPLVE